MAHVSLVDVVLFPPRSACPAATGHADFFWFFAHLSGWRTADPADLLVSRQQIEAGRGHRELYVSAGLLGGVSHFELAV